MEVQSVRRLVNKLRKENVKEKLNEEYKVNAKGIRVVIEELKQRVKAKSAKMWGILCSSSPAPSRTPSDTKELTGFALYFDVDFQFDFLT